MARMRTVKPQFFTSLAIAGIDPPLARLTFIGLWTYVDDDGRGVDDARLIKAAIWPLDDETTSADVEAHLAALAKAGRIVRYMAGGRNYLTVVNFDEHQRPNKPVASTLPPPPEVPECESPAQDVCADSEQPTTEEGTEDEGSTNGAVRPVVVVGGVYGLGGVGGVERGSPAAPQQRTSRTATDAADAVTMAWWESHDPRPPNNFVGVRKIVARLIDSGFEPDRVRWALDDAPTPTLAALQLSLNRTNGRDRDPLAGVRQYAAEEGLL